jgi:hypothetical protein
MPPRTESIHQTLSEGFIINPGGWTLSPIDQVANTILHMPKHFTIAGMILNPFHKAFSDNRKIE